MDSTEKQVILPPGGAIQPIVSIGGRRVIGIRLYNKGANPLSGLELWAIVTSRQPLDLIPPEPWEKQLSLGSEFTTAGPILSAARTTPDPTSLGVGQQWSGTINAALFSQLELRAGSTAGTTIVVQVEVD